MTGLKSGSGDDLWGDDDSDGTEDRSESEGSDGGTSDRVRADRGNDDSRESGTDRATEATTESSGEASNDESVENGGSVDTSRSSEAHSYIIRRAVQDKSVQFERDERLTFFVHDDVAEGERNLITDLQSTLGRDVPKFDVREAVYRAALRNSDDVLEELLEMGYSLDEE